MTFVDNFTWGVGELNRDPYVLSNRRIGFATSLIQSTPPWPFGRFFFNAMSSLAQNTSLIYAPPSSDWSSNSALS